MRNIFTRLMTMACMLGLFTPALHAALDSSKPDFEVYGFAQVDYIQDFQRVDPNWAATMRASKVPTTEGQFGDDGQALISGRQTRLGAQGNLPTDHGAVMAKVEFDFFGVGADAGQTTIRFRHGYGEWNGILAGQTNSLFMDDDMWPNILDYWGPSGMVFLRNPQIRWTPMTGNRTFAVAIEHPNNDVDVGEVRQIDPNLGADIKSVSQLPDLTARVKQTTGFGYIQLAGILRRLGYETVATPPTPGNSPKGSDVGWGLDLTSTIKVMEKDKILLSGVYGSGIANYMNDGGMDLAAERDGAGAEGVAVPLFGIMAYYDHTWNEKFTSSFGYGRTQVENTDLQTADAYHSGEYASVNLIYYPTKNVFFGGEYLWAQRRDSGGAMGTDNRLQFSFNYKFSSKEVFGK